MEAVITDMPCDSKNAAKTYVAEKRVPQLFESITAGLLHHRPENPVEFVQECLENIRDRPELIKWNSFIEYKPSERSMSASTTRAASTRADTKSPFTHDHKLPAVDPSKREIEASISQGYTKYTEGPEGYRDLTDDGKPMEEGK